MFFSCFYNALYSNFDKFIYIIDFLHSSIAEYADVAYLALVFHVTFSPIGKVCISKI